MKLGPARFAPAPLLLLVAVVTLSACGGGGGGSKGVSGGTLPWCAQSGAAIAVPPEVDAVPLPRGSVVSGTRKDAAGNTVFLGSIPGDLDAVRDYFRAELPKRGYTLGEGDAEEHEAETEFSGHGIEAHLKLHDVEDCDGVVTLELAVS